MFVFAGAFMVVTLALAIHCAHAQPTYDVSGLEDRIFYWRDAGEMLEEIARSLQHVVIHQERQQERMERLEMQVSQLQQQVNDVENHNARYADEQQSILALCEVYVNLWELVELLTARCLPSVYCLLRELR